jgi:hypothetical protein
MTGKPFASLGAVTERTWQSSLISRPSMTGPVIHSNRDGRCGQTGPRRGEAGGPCVGDAASAQQCAVVLGK